MIDKGLEALSKEWCGIAREAIALGHAWIGQRRDELAVEREKEARIRANQAAQQALYEGREKRLSEKQAKERAHKETDAAPVSPDVQHV